MREVTVAVVQMDTTLGESDANLAKMGEMIRQVVARQRVDVIVFPELATTGSDCGARFTQLNQRVPGPSVNVGSIRRSDRVNGRQPSCDSRIRRSRRTVSSSG